MSDESEGMQVCPTCGAALPAGARYCPSCGARIVLEPDAERQSFEDAIADVIDDQSTGSLTDEQPVVEPPAEVAVTTPAERAEEWTAAASEWTSPSTVLTTPEEARRPGQNRVLWIILAIFGFIIFCCCALFFALIAIGSRDTAFQDEVSRLAVAHRGEAAVCAAFTDVERAHARLDGSVRYEIVFLQVASERA
jgi:hypothetical protein